MSSWGVVGGLVAQWDARASARSSTDLGASERQRGSPGLVPHSCGVLSAPQLALQHHQCWVNVGKMQLASLLVPALVLLSTHCLLSPATGPS